MKLPKCSLDKQVISAAAVLFLLFAGSPVGAAEKKPADRRYEAGYSMGGIRLGAWVDQEESVENDSISADFPDASFYTELFYDLRITPVFLAEISLGIISRGDATFRYGDDKYIGTINLYPILLQLKFSPLSGRSRTLHPFLVGGGGLVFGKHNTDIISVTGIYRHPDLVEDTETAFMSVIGGGVDIALADQVGLTIAAKYHAIDFGDSLAEISDYSGLAVSFGVAYYIHKK
jgi:hypothetical protein